MDVMQTIPNLIVTAQDVDEMCGILGESVAAAQKTLFGGTA